MESYEKVYKTRKRIFIDNFIGGISWGLGATIGFSVVLTILGYIFTKINVIPVVGTFVSKVVEFVLQNDPQLIK